MLTGAGTPRRTREGSYNNPKEEVEKSLWVLWSVHLSHALLLPSFPVYTNLSHCGSSLTGPVRWQPSLVGGVIVLPTRWSDRQCSKGKELTGPSNVRLGPPAICFLHVGACCIVVPWSMQLWLRCASPRSSSLPSSWALLPLGHSIRDLSDEQINNYVCLLAPKQGTECPVRRPCCVSPGAPGDMTLQSPWTLRIQPWSLVMVCLPQEKFSQHLGKQK